MQTRAHALRRRLLQRPRPALLAALAALLALPALWTGLQLDDYQHRAVLHQHAGAAGVAAAMDLFVFLDGDAARTRALIAHGAMPWWTLPTARVAFWRPLSALTHWLDYQLWPEMPALMHAHSLLWLAGLVAAAALLFRRIMGDAPAAGLAAALYALDAAHGFGAAWLANRNALCAALFGVLALLAHQRWRQGGGRAAAWRSCLWLACGLLSAEAAVATLAYLAAYALCLEAGGWRARLLSLAPALLVVCAWRALYRALGYGSWGTAYIDPLLEPLRYAAALAERAPLLLAAQWSLLPAEAAPLLPASLGPPLWIGAAALVGLLGWALAPLLRRDKLARFWALGMLLALLPPCAALPANRLLFFVGLGAFGLLARFARSGEGRQATGDAGLDARLRGSPHAPRSSSFATRARRLVRRGLLLIHLLLAPLLLPLAAGGPALLGDAGAALRALPHGIAGRSLVVVAAPSVFSLSPIDVARGEAGLPLPASTLLLAPNVGGVALRRLDRRTLEARPARGFLDSYDAVFRARWHPLREGETIRVAGAMVTVGELTADGRPASAVFRFDAPLDNEGLVWLVWRGGRYEAFALPAEGESVWVEPGL
jgi:hypothetical protein